VKFALPLILTKLGQKRVKIGVCALALVFCTAPTPGDVGGCGQKPAILDPGVFFASKANIDCRRCEECNLASVSCSNVCNFPESYPSTFSENCVPLVHDGEVCLRALQHASCDDYASYMSDSAPSVPTECNFCPEPAP